MALVVVVVPLALAFWVGAATNFWVGGVTWFVASWILGFIHQASKRRQMRSSTWPSLWNLEAVQAAATRIDKTREKAIADILKSDERVLANTSVQMLPDPEDQRMGVLYLTNQRLVWHFPKALAGDKGGVPLYILRQGAYADDLLVLKMDVSGMDTLWFQLYPGPISALLVDKVFGLADEFRRGQGKPPFIQSSDPDELLTQ